MIAVLLGHTLWILASQERGGGLGAETNLAHAATSTVMPFSETRTLSVQRNGEGLPELLVGVAGDGPSFWAERIKA